MIQFDTIISIYVRHALTFFDSFMKMQGPEGKCKDEKENARTKRKMQGRHRKLFLGSLRANRAIKNVVLHTYTLLLFFFISFCFLTRIISLLLPSENLNSLTTNTLLLYSPAIVGP